MKILLRVLLLISICACGKQKPSAKTSIPNTIALADYKKGEYYYDSTDHKDSAFIYFFNATKAGTDSPLIAQAFAYMALIQQAAGDFLGAQESALEGIKISREHKAPDPYTLSSLYNTMGVCYVGLKNYTEAIKFYKLAAEIPQDPRNINIYRNNIAVALRDAGQLKEALDSFLAIPAADNESKRDFARRITNIASLKWRTDPRFNPLPDLHQALNLRMQERNKGDIIAAYNHLAAYYQASMKDSALYYARKMYSLAQENNNPDDQLDALEKLISLASTPESQNFFEIYQHLRDSVIITQNAAKNQFAFIRYESEKSKAENLLLQEENARKELQILRQQITVYGSIGLAIAIVVLVIWRYQRKRRQTKLEAEARIRDNQLKISQKIHDIVANGLYRIMSELEHTPEINKENLLDKIEELYERSRDISYDSITKKNVTATHINELLTSFATPDTKISVVGNKEELWNSIPPMIVKELEPVLQELMVNMKKHSNARHVVLHFTKSREQLVIHYKDDGRGFPPNFNKGNGLTSTGNRIKQINGQITFAEETANGAIIEILIPILSNDQKSINS